jgi:hypothetical protein
MRRWIALTAAVVGLLAIVGVSPAAQPFLAKGGGENSAGWTLAFTGHDNPDMGELQATSPAGSRLHGEVTCAVFDGGQRAVLTGTLSNGNYVKLLVEDNGEGANANTDRAEFLQHTAPLSCVFGRPLDAMVTGNIQVK